MRAVLWSLCVLLVLPGMSGCQTDNRGLPEGLGGGASPAALEPESAGISRALTGTEYVPPGTVDTPLVHAPYTPLALTRLPVRAVYRDVGADRGGGIWAVTSTAVYYWPSPGAQPFTYTQTSAGLARSNTNYRFASVAGGLAGHAYVGNLGAIGDHLVVNPTTGAVVQVENMVVPYFPRPEYQEHLTRVTAGVRMLVDFDGTYNGTLYNGGVHGVTAWHGVNAPCGCYQFEEHVHFIPESGCDSTVPSAGCWGGDARGLAISPQGDLWIGDEHFVALLPQRSLGPDTGLFEFFSVGLDVFPSANDEVMALATDPAGGVWVASYGQGLAYLAPETYQPSYYDRSRQLPQNRVTAVAVDPLDGSVWVGTDYGGIARKQGDVWRYYTWQSGLPSDGITAIFIDRYASPRRVLIATQEGVAMYTGP
ncbi:MAG TPA: hypothetical protein VH877_02920 [Polyangia bacterium]|nr:hypothetical protein [Polyangia bacterium]